MATTQDLIQVKTEETPIYEGAATGATPYRLSTVAAYMPIQSARIDPAPQLLDRSDEVRGLEGALARLVNGYEPAGTLSIRAYIDSLVFLLNASGLTDTITAGNGVITDPDSATIPTGAYRHVFTKRAGITAKTLQVILAYVDEGVFLRGNGFGVSGFTLNAAGEVTADLMGLVVSNVADPNLTPALPAGAIYPLRRGDMSLTWLANTGTTDDFTMSIANPLNRRSSLGLSPPSFFPDKMEHGDERVYLTGSIPKSALADADVDNLISAGTFASTAKWKTVVNIGATSYKYGLWIQMPACQYVGGQADELANRRHLGGSFDWFAAWDETLGYDFKITAVCAVSQIEAYV
jgi:hypothetical protein